MLAVSPSLATKPHWEAMTEFVYLRPSIVRAIRPASARCGVSCRYSSCLGGRQPSVCVGTVPVVTVVAPASAPKHTYQPFDEHSKHPKVRAAAVGLRSGPCSTAFPHLSCRRLQARPAQHSLRMFSEDSKSSGTRMQRFPACSTRDTFGIPHFVSHLNILATERQTEDSSYDNTRTANGEAHQVVASPDVEAVHVGQTPSLPDFSQPPYSSDATQGKGDCDLRRLQCRYDSLLLRPSSFGLQVQLLHSIIRKAQRLHDACVYLNKLQPLQERIRTPRTNACLEVHPVLYAAFCIYSPSHIHIAATKRVGAAEHFLRQYIMAKSRTKSRSAFTGLAGCGQVTDDQWLANTSLKNVCVYPLEALSPRLRLFCLTAPSRLAAWEGILTRALAF